MPAVRDHDLVTLEEVKDFFNYGGEENTIIALIKGVSDFLEGQLV